MDIKALKNRLDIIEVAEKLGIVVNPRTLKALCPFHDDKNPSLQFSKEKQICTCFSSNCTAGTMDVVELVKKYNKWELPETLNWLKEQVGMSVANENPERPKGASGQVSITDRQRIQILTNLFETFTRSFASSKKPQHYLESRHLDPRKVKAGYNIGQFHHSINLPKENPEEYRKQYEALGLIRKINSGYMVFGKGCVVFPLRNWKGEIVSFYFRETNTTKSDQHYYLKNRQGLYPGYPKRATQKLILTESIIDAETLLQVGAERKSRHSGEYEILSCYGTEGTEEQREAIKELEELQEVVIFF